jgi:hypothetical protein
MLVINNRPTTDDPTFDGLFIGTFAPVDKKVVLPTQDAPLALKSFSGGIKTCEVQWR